MAFRNTSASNPGGGGGGGTVTTNATLIGNGSVGTPLGINLNNANTWTAVQTFNSGDLIAPNINPAPASGVNVAGTNFVLAAGAGTGNATPSLLQIQAPKSGSSGSTVQTAKDVAWFSSDASNNPAFYLGNQPSQLTGTMQGMPGSGSNNVAVGLNIGPGASTGNALSGNLQLFYSVPGSSGTTLQSFATAATFSGSTGAATFSASNTSGGAVTIAPGVVASGTQSTLVVTPPASTGQTASTEVIGANFNMSATRTWASGALATQREVVFQAPVYQVGNGNAITTAATVAIASAPSAGGDGSTITKALAFWVQAGRSEFDGTVMFSPQAQGNVMDVGISTAKSVTVTSQNTGSAALILAPLAAASGTQGTLLLTGPASTGQAAGSEVNGVNFNFTATRTWATGAIATQREFYIQAPTYAFAAASTITNASTVYIANAPQPGANATITNAMALTVAAGSSVFGSVGNLNLASTNAYFGTSGGDSFIAIGKDATHALQTGWQDASARVLINSVGTTIPITLAQSGSAKAQLDASGNWSSVTDGVSGLGDSTHRWANAFIAQVNVQGSGQVSGFVNNITAPAKTSGTRGMMQLTTVADTGQTASTEINAINFNCSATRQWATGAITTQREIYIQAPTYAFVAASTITNAATVAISGAPGVGSNATLTNPMALWIQGGAVNLGDGTVTQITSITTGVTVNAASGVITTVSATLAAGATATFTVTNSAVNAGSVPIVSLGAYGGTFGTNGTPLVSVSSVAAGSFNITIYNAHASNALNGTLKINFAGL